MNDVFADAIALGILKPGTPFTVTARYEVFMPKRKNPQDATLRNVRANAKHDERQDDELAELLRWVATLGTKVKALEDAVRTLQAQRASLEAKFDKLKS